MNRRILILWIVFFSTLGIHAKSYAIVGLGLQLDLGEMGGTITKDGIERPLTSAR